MLSEHQLGACLCACTSLHATYTARLLTHALMVMEVCVQMWESEYIAEVQVLPCTLPLLSLSLSLRPSSRTLSVTECHPCPSPFYFINSSLSRELLLGIVGPCVVPARSVLSFGPRGTFSFCVLYSDAIPKDTGIISLALPYIYIDIRRMYTLDDGWWQSEGLGHLHSIYIVFLFS